jgi:hypothetical protein
MDLILCINLDIFLNVALKDFILVIKMFWYLLEYGFLASVSHSNAQFTEDLFQKNKKEILQEKIRISFPQ